MFIWIFKINIQIKKAARLGYENMHRKWCFFLDRLEIQGFSLFCYEE